MIGLSFLQYKNAYGTNLYRQGELNFPARMKSILGMSPRPAFVQVQTWNDGPEAHYFGNLWDEQNTGNSCTPMPKYSLPSSQKYRRPANAICN